MGEGLPSPHYKSFGGKRYGQIYSNQQEIEESTERVLCKEAKYLGRIKSHDAHDAKWERIQQKENETGRSKERQIVLWRYELFLFAFYDCYFILICEGFYE